jgi:hypothetical protein
VQQEVYAKKGNTRKERQGKPVNHRVSIVSVVSTISSTRQEKNTSQHQTALELPAGAHLINRLTKTSRKYECLIWRLKNYSMAQRKNNRLFEKNETSSAIRHLPGSISASCVRDVHQEDVL